MNYLKNKKFQKIFLIYSITFLGALYIYNAYIDGNNNDIELDEKAFAKYSKGQVYIGDAEFLDSLEVSENDILVEDERDGSDPSMKIRNSYLVTDSNDRKEILEILCKYEEKYPSDWERTIEAMDLEWEAHNVLYYLNYKKDHTTDVDLDNDDEEKYSKVLRP